MAGHGAFPSSGPDPVSGGRSASSIDLQGDSEALFGDIQPFTLSCFNQSTFKRQIVRPKVLYLYLFSLNLQLTFFSVKTRLVSCCMTSTLPLL